MLTHKLSFLQNHTPGVQTKTNDFMFVSKSEWLTRQLWNYNRMFPFVSNICQLTCFFSKCLSSKLAELSKPFNHFFDKSNG